MMEQKHRDACDACHHRKIRCPATGPGACSNCQDTGRVCTFSPRYEMGRPRKSVAAAKKKEREARKSNNSTAGKNASSTSTPTIPATAPMLAPATEEVSPRLLQISHQQQQHQDHLMHERLPIARPEMFAPMEEESFESMMYQHDMQMSDSNMGSTIGSSTPEWPGPMFGNEGFDMSFLDLQMPQSCPPPTSHGYSTPPPSWHKPQLLKHNSESSVWPPMPYAGVKRPLLSSHMRYDSTSSTASTCTGSIGYASPPDACRQISRILFSLRLEHNRPWSSQDVYAADNIAACRREGVFQSVSSLCDIVQTVVDGTSKFSSSSSTSSSPADQERAAFDDAEEKHTSIMLAITAIGVVLDIYRALNLKYASGASPAPYNSSLSGSSSNNNSNSLGNSNGNGNNNNNHSTHHGLTSFLEDMFAQDQSGAAGCLNCILQLTTMDFHLLRLQRIFNHLTGGQAGDNYNVFLASPGTNDLSHEIQAVRQALQGNIEGLRCTENCMKGVATMGGSAGVVGC